MALMGWRSVPPDPVLLCVALGSVTAVILVFVWLIWRPGRVGHDD